VIVDLKGRGNYLNKQFVARAIADADALLSLAHFKGHPAGGYGAAIKNIGVGCASKRGKMNLHGALAGDKPVIKAELCPGYTLLWKTYGRGVESKIPKEMMNLRNAPHKMEGE
jgi:uncharacterized Fe-S center protein